MPEKTPWDIHFSVWRVPVRVTPGFWLTHAIIACIVGYRADWPNSILGPPLAALGYIVCVTAAVLLHELGHALAGRRLGADAEVALTWFGGVAEVGVESHRRGHRILTVLAGPAVNLLIAAVAFGALYYLHHLPLPSEEEMTRAYNENPDGPWSEPGPVVVALRSFTFGDQH